MAVRITQLEGAAFVLPYNTPFNTKLVSKARINPQCTPCTMASSPASLYSGLFSSTLHFAEVRKWS